MKRLEKLVEHMNYLVLFKIITIFTFSALPSDFGPSKPRASSTHKPVAFLAYPIEEDSYYGAFEQVLFPGVITNIGDHYNATNSTFECPFHGVYIISLTVKGWYAYKSHYSIMRDDILIGSAHVDSDEVMIFPTGTMVSVIECEVGQKVWVRVGDYQASLMGGSARESVFSGYMLYSY